MNSRISLRNSAQGARVNYGLLGSENPDRLAIPATAGHPPDLGG